MREFEEEKKEKICIFCKNPFLRDKSGSEYCIEHRGQSLELLRAMRSCNWDLDFCKKSCKWFNSGCGGEIKKYRHFLKHIYHQTGQQIFVKDLKDGWEKYGTPSISFIDARSYLIKHHFLECVFNPGVWRDFEDVDPEHKPLYKLTEKGIKVLTIPSLYDQVLENRKKANEY